MHACIALSRLPPTDAGFCRIFEQIWSLQNVLNHVFADHDINVTRFVFLEMEAGGYIA
jgi:hypothetical protein